MNFFEKILAGLNGQMETPTSYGWFHLMFLFFTILGCVLLVMLAIKNRDNEEKAKKTTRIVVLTYAILVILLEIYKQLNFSYNPSTDTWHYQWYAFPFQFCSTPMYVALLAGCLKGGKFQEWLYSYLATFALFGGICVMLYPNDVFIGTIGINIQTMICHGGMVVMGVYLLASGLVKLKFTTIFKAMAIFGGLCSLALIMNIIYHATGETATFNMFFISPYLPCTLPILSLVFSSVPYPIFLLVYILGFSFAGFLMLSIAILFDRFIKNEIARREVFEDDKAFKIIMRAIKEN